MKELAAITRAIMQMSNKNFSLLDVNSTQKGGKEMQLFYGIRSKTYKNDETAAMDLYREKPNSPKYKSLKSRLKQKLLPHLFFLDFDKETIKESYKFEQECLNYFYFGRVLFIAGEYEAAMSFLKKSITLAKKGAYTYIIIESMELLRTIYAFNGNLKLYKQNQKQLEEYRKIHTYESEAIDLYYSNKFRVEKSVRSRKESLKTVSRGLERMHELWLLSNSYNIFELHYKLKIIYSEMVGNFKEIIKITGEIEDQYKKSLINRRRFNLRLNRHVKIYAHLRSGDYEYGLNYAKEYLPYMNRAYTNWFAYIENYFLLAMHAKKYPLAFEIFRNATHNPNFEKVKKSVKETWSLFRAYLYFVYPDKSLLKNFNYKQFVTYVPEYSKDKLGFNVAILILQCLNYLKKNDLDALLFRVESLKKYKQRHFRDNHSLRTKLFFRLLFAAVHASMREDLLSKKINDIHEKLKDTPPPGDAYAKIEIIPYEHLWKMILDMMSKNS